MKKSFILIFMFMSIIYSATKEDFNKEYQEWKDWVDNSKMVTPNFKSPKLKKIINLGVQVLPYIFDEIQKGTDIYSKYILEAVPYISRKQFEIEKWEGKFGLDFKAKELYLHWWKEGRKETPSIFNKYCTDYEAAIKDKREEDSKELLMRIKRLGIDVLPYMIEKLKNENEYLVPVFIELTTVKDSDKNLKETATKEECLKWWEENKENWLLPPVESK